MGIRSFSHKGLYKLYIEDDPSEIAAKHVQKILRVLNALDNATSTTDLAYPGSGFHSLQPRKLGKYSMKVDKRFRVTFEWDAAKGEALRVNLEDYH